MIHNPYLMDEEGVQPVFVGFPQGTLHDTAGLIRNQQYAPLRAVGVLSACLYRLVLVDVDVSNGTIGNELLGRFLI